MRNIKLVIEYDGKEFHGWQKQPNKLNIQGTIEKAIEQVTGEKVDLMASGRTDSNLKKSILIQSAKEMDEKFHSRLSCKRKTYRYVINHGEIGTAIYRNLETYIPKKLNVDKMKEAIRYFEGEHDFKAFKASGTSAKSSVRTIYKAEIIEKENDRIWIELTGNGFLYNMVRIIAGTLVEVGLGKIEPKEIKDIIGKKERKNAGKTLPPQGLYLVQVEYDT